jgi:outer membrane protein assembly factor BamD (BamD/ComL family)
MAVSISRTRILAYALVSALAVMAFGSCASSPVAVKEGLSPAELIQRAQDAYDRDRYAEATSYYQAVLARFPNDMASVCAADYEIAFIQYKEKRFEEAKAGFRALLERYKTADAALLPAQYKVLGEKILAKIELQKK